MTFNLTIRNLLHRALENLGKCWKRKTCSIKMVNLKDDRNYNLQVRKEKIRPIKSKRRSKCRRENQRVRYVLLVVAKENWNEYKRTREMVGAKETQREKCYWNNERRTDCLMPNTVEAYQHSARLTCSVALSVGRFPHRPCTGPAPWIQTYHKLCVLKPVRVHARLGLLERWGWNPDLVPAGYEIWASDLTSLCPMVIPAWKGAVRTDHRAVTCTKCWARHLMAWVDRCHSHVHYRLQKALLTWWAGLPALSHQLHCHEGNLLCFTSLEIHFLLIEHQQLMRHLLHCLLLLCCLPPPSTHTYILLGILFSPRLLLGDLIHCLQCLIYISNRDSELQTGKSWLKCVTSGLSLTGLKWDIQIPVCEMMTGWVLDDPKSQNPSHRWTQPRAFVTCQ